MIQTSPQWVENYIFIVLWVPSQSCKKTKFNNGGRPRVTFCHGSFRLLLLSSKCNWVDVMYTKSNCVWCNITLEIILKSCINSWQESIPLIRQESILEKRFCMQDGSIQGTSSGSFTRVCQRSPLLTWRVQKNLRMNFRQKWRNSSSGVESLRA